MNSSLDKDQKVSWWRIFWYAGYTSFWYVVGGSFFTTLLAKLHPYIALTISAWWFLMLTFVTYQAVSEKRRKDDEWVKGVRFVVGAESEPFSVESVYGAHLTAVICIPFVFAYTCKYLEATFPGSYSGLAAADASLLDWYIYSAYHYIDTIFWGSANLFGAWSIKMEAAALSAKALLLIFRVVVAGLYISTVFVTYRTLRTRWQG